jgi:hypothetical protein
MLTVHPSIILFILLSYIPYLRTLLSLFRLHIWGGFPIRFYGELFYVVAYVCVYVRHQAPAVQVHDPASQSAEDNDDDEEEEGHGEGASNSVTGDGDGDGVGDDGGAVPEGNSPTVTFTVTAGNTAINADSGTGEGGGGGGLPLTGFLDNMAQLRPLQRHALEFLRHNLNPHRWGEISRRLENFYRPNITSPQVR